MTIAVEVQAYVDAAGSPVGSDEQTGFALDTENLAPRIITRSVTNSATDGLRAFDVQSGDEIGTATVAEIMGAGYPSFTFGAPFCITPDGKIAGYVKTFFGNASAQFVLIDFDTKSLIDTLNDTGTIPGEAIIVPQSLGATKVAGYCYVAAAETFVEGKTVSILLAGPSTIDSALHDFDVDEGQALVCGTPESVGKIYILGRGPNGSDGAPAGIYETVILAGAEAFTSALYPLTNPKIATTPKGKFSPSEIDPQWTEWTGVVGPGFDRSDGNLIVMAASSDFGITNHHRVAKISATDGSVIWSTPVIGIVSAAALGASIIDGGLFKFMTGSTSYVLSTVNGAVIDQQDLGLGANSVDSVDDYWTNSSYFYGGLSSLNPPTPHDDNTIADGLPRWLRTIYGPAHSPCDDFASDGCSILEVPCVTCWTQCWRITRKDGLVFRFTALDRDLIFNGETYDACGSLSPSAAESSTTVGSIQNVEAQGIITSDLITDEDLYGGKFDDAFVEVWLVPWAVDATGAVEQDTREPSRALASGWTGTVSHDGSLYKAEVLGGGARLSQQSILEVYAPSCRWVFGGDECTVDLEPLARACSVIIASNRAIITADIGAASGSSGVDDGGIQWANGRAIWRTGRNAGETCEVKTADFDSGEIVFWALPPYLPEAGDEFDLFPGCDQLAATCKDVYDNYLNFGGFPDVPGDDAIREAPDVKY